MSSRYISEQSVRAVHARVERRFAGELRCEICQRCVGIIPMEIAHKISKGMGGRHNAAAGLIDDPDNLLYLCVLCHRVLGHNEGNSTYGIISCATCRVHGRCVEYAEDLGLRDPDDPVPHALQRVASE